MSFLLFLAKKGLFREEDIPELASQSAKTLGGLDEILSRGGMITADINTLKAEYYGIETRSLEGHKVAGEILKYIPEESARHYQVAPRGVVDHTLEVGIVDPDLLG